MLEGSRSICLHPFPPRCHVPIVFFLLFLQLPALVEVLSNVSRHLHLKVVGHLSASPCAPSSAGPCRARAASSGSARRSRVRAGGLVCSSSSYQNPDVPSEVPRRSQKDCDQPPCSTR